MTALFCDLVGSASLGETLDPEILRAVLERYHDTMRAVVERHGGRTEKFIGDAVVGVFGIPVVHEDDALRAARAALDMHGALPALNAGLADYGAVLQIRVGLQSGEVLAGEQSAHVGAVAGDAFNTASRLQVRAGAGETIVGDATAGLLGGSARLEPLAEMVLAGKERPVRAFRLVSVDSHRRVRTSTPLIGRERALSTLQRAYEDAVLDGACVLATVLGLPGIGKSRLARELAATLAGEATVLVGQTPTYGEGQTYAPVVEILVGAAQMPGRDSATVAGELRALLSGLPDGAAVADRLADLLGVGDGAAAGETSWAVRRLLEHLAGSRPLVVVVDDVHWADPALLDLLDKVVDELRAPVLVLCLSRPDLLDQQPGWAGGKRRAVTITLEPLAEDAAHELARLLLAGPGRDGVVSRVARAAEGNPFYLEQYAAMVAEGADIDVSLPPSIHSLLAARLDALDRGDADILAAAAAQGREFDVSILGLLLGTNGEVAAVTQTLERLEHRDLVRRLDHPGERWAFSHALVRDAAERRLPKLVRAERHERLAELLELDGLADQETIGLHLERAAALRAELGLRDPQTVELETRAGRLLAAAGASAFARLDLLSASSLLGRAARLLPTAEAERLALLPDLGVALTEIGRPEEGARLLEGAVTAARSAALPAEALRATVQLLSTRIYLEPSETDLKQAQVAARATLAELEQIGDHQGLAQAWVLIEYLDEMQGEISGAAEACIRAIEHARTAGRLREQIQASGELPYHTYHRGAAPDSIEQLAIRLGGDDPIAEATSLTLRALAAALGGDVAAFREHDRAAAAARDSRGLDFLSAAHDSILPLAVLELGGEVEAERRFEQAAATMRRAGDVWWEFSIEVWRLVPLLAQGKTSEAADLLRALEVYKAPRAVDTSTILTAARARVASEHGDEGEALRIGREAVRLAAVPALVVPRCLALENLAHVAAAQGYADEARQALQEALRLHDRRRSVPGMERVEARLAELSLPKG